MDLLYGVDTSAMARMKFDAEYHEKGYSHANMLQYYELAKAMGWMIRPRFIICHTKAQFDMICKEMNWHSSCKPQIQFLANPNQLYGYRNVPVLLCNDWHLIKQAQEFYLQMQIYDCFIIDHDGRRVTVDGKPQ